MALQQTARKTITGTVTDAHGDPLIGVSIRIKNAQGGTITDIDGKIHHSSARVTMYYFSWGDNGVPSFVDGGEMSEVIRNRNNNYL